MGKLVSLKRETPTVDKDVRDAVNRVLDGNYPFVLLAKVGDEWEHTCHIPNEISDYEISGVLTYVNHTEYMTEYDS